jgi:hypothetical protein
MVGYLAAAVLGVEFLMQNRGTSFCKTVTCDIIGDYTRFGELFILGAGIQFFLLVATIMFFAHRYDKTRILPVIVTLSLVGAMAFEGVLLGFQFFSLQSVCLICAGVFITVLLLLVFWSFAVVDGKVFVLGLSACVAGILGMYILNPAPGLGKGEVGLDPVFRQAGFEDITVQKRRLTLITSMTCPHCQTVILQMALHKEALKDDLLAFAFIDAKEEPLQVVGLFAANVERTREPLSLLFGIKSGQVLGNTELLAPDDAMIDSVRKKNLHTSLYLKLLGLTGVPVLIADENSEQIRILVGANAILQYLNIEM